MNQIKASDNLSYAIVTLQVKQANELLLVKEQLHITYQSLRPINLIKNAIQEVTESSELKNNLINNLIGLTTGYLTKKVLVGATANPVKNLLGIFLQFVAANIISKNSMK